MLSVGMKLYKENGKDVVVNHIEDKFIIVTVIKQITVTFNNGKEKYLQEVKRNETYTNNDLGAKLFYNYEETPIGRYEEETRIKLELIEKDKKKKLQKLKRILNINFLESKSFWENNLTEVLDEKEFKKLLSKFVISWFKKQKLRTPDHDQAQCISDVFNDVLVVARAGSGKTSTIINKATFLTKHCRVMPSEILILTFNKEATNEVNERLIELTGENGLQAMTFHALAYAIVHPEEEIIFDDEDSGFSKSRTIQDIINTYINDKNWIKKIKKFMLEYFRVDWEGIEKLGYLLGPEDMVKYRKSIPKVGLDGRYYKSRGEKLIADFLFEYDIPYLYEKNYWWDDINYKPDFSIPSNNFKYKGIIIEYFGIEGDKSYDEQTNHKKLYWENKSKYIYIELFPDDKLTFKSLVAKLDNSVKKCDLELKKLSKYEIWLRIKGRAIDEFSILVSQFIGRCRKALIYPDDLKKLIYKKSGDFHDLDTEFIDIVSNIYKDYLDTLKRNNEEDFDGLLIRADKMVRNGETRWRRKSGVGDLANIKYLFIDEYQDFSLLFYNLIDGIIEKNNELKLFCVGDDWQAINGFAGSDLKFFNNFLEYFIDSKELTLASNYRSYRQIINISNNLMKGEGISSKSVHKELGEVYTLYLNDFTPNDFEKSLYDGDVITPALIRVINIFIKREQRVVLLSRRRNGIPFYNNYSTQGNNFQKDMLINIRKAFPEEKRHLIVGVNTVHSYKGKEEHAIIVLDGLYNSYPLIHPSNRFFKIIGTTISSVISEEKRLFYVALSRAQKSLIIVTEKGNESPFLKENILNQIQVEQIDVNKLNMPKRDNRYYLVSVSNSRANSFNRGTFAVKSDLRANNYKWNSKKKHWYKHYSAKNFSINKLLEEYWLKKGDGLIISITDEFNNMVDCLELKNGVVNNQVDINF